MNKFLVTMFTLLVMVVSTLSFAESTIDVTLEWSDFTTEYVSFTTHSAAAKEQVVEIVKDDALEFIASKGTEITSVLELVFNEIRVQNEDLLATDIELAKGLVTGNVLVKFK